MFVVVVVVVLFDLTPLRRLSFLDATRLVSSSSLSLSHLKRSYRGVTVRLGRPLTAVTRLALSDATSSVDAAQGSRRLFVDVQPFVLSLLSFNFVVVVVVLVVLDLTSFFFDVFPFLSRLDSTFSSSSSSSSLFFVVLVVLHFLWSRH